MKKLISAAFIVFTLLVISGCGDGSSRAVDRHVDNYVPELLIYDIVDSYGNDSADPEYPFYEILDESVFDVYWEVNSLEDYTVTLILNDRPVPTGGIALHSQVCGAGRRCDQGGGWICDYFDDYMSCEDAVTPVDVLPLTRKTQNLYLVMNICDSDSPYCEYDYYSVIVE